MGNTFTFILSYSVKPGTFVDMAWKLGTGILAIFLTLAILSKWEVNADQATDQVMDAIKKASKNLPGGMKLSVMGDDDMNMSTDDDDEDDDDEDDDDNEGGPMKENGVLVLTDDNFDEFVFPASEKSPVLVEFYAPWCGHCKSLAPEYEAAAKRLKKLKNPVYLAKVDSTEHKDISAKYDISGYPTLKWFRDGQAYDYDGPREADGIYDYMRKRASPDWKPPPVAVITLSQDNFTDFINGHDLSLVEFYAPWCGHCKKLAPEYEKAAQTLKEKDIPLAKVDATESKELGSEYAQGYPTLKVFRRGTVYEYKGGRDEHAGIVSYMQKQQGDPSKEQKTLKDLQKFMSEDDVTVVGFFEDESALSYQLYIEAANDIRDDYKFAHTFDAAARTHYKANANSAIVFMSERFYTKYEPKYNTFEITEDTKAQAIRDFIGEHDVPLVGEYTTSTTKRYADRPLVLIFYTVDFSYDGRKATQLWRNKIASIANDYRGLTFAIADEDNNKQMWQDFGFGDSGEEMNVGILGEKDRKYPMEAMDEFDTDMIVSFLKSFQNGKAKAIIKSQSLPKKQKGPVTVVVGNSFEKVVLDEKKDVLIELYAPWCGHCKKLDPIYKKLAKKLKDEKNLVIAKMDATANDAPAEFSSEGFPTIYFAPANNKKNPIKFGGASREVSDFEEFIQEHASVSSGADVKTEL